MSFKAFALATLIGMIPPTFALTYFGSTVITVEWPFILSGVLLIIIFLFLPKWIMKNRKTRWVRLIQGEMPSLPTEKSSESVVKQSVEESCSWCGAEMKK